MVYSLHHKAIKTHFVFLYVGCSLMKSVWWRWWPDGGCRVSLSAPLCHTLLYITHRLLIRVITDVISLSVIHTLCLFLTLIFITLYCKDNHSKQLYLYLCLKNITSSSYRHFFFSVFHWIDKVVTKLQLVQLKDTIRFGGVLFATQCSFGS